MFGYKLFEVDINLILFFIKLLALEGLKFVSIEKIEGTK